MSTISGEIHSGDNEVHRFRLDDGFRDAAGTVHRDGCMRPARVADELWALKDFRVHVWPERLLEVILPRLFVKLGTLEHVDAGIVQALSPRDRAHLEALYREVNTYAG